MKKVICLENSKSLSKTISEELRLKNIETISFTEAILGIQQIHKDPPDLIIISSLLTDLRGADALEYLKDNNTLKNIPIIIYSTVTNPMNNIYFKQADVFIKRDEHFIENITLQAEILLKKEVLEHFSKEDISRIDILSAIDKIYHKRDILNIIILNLLDEAFILTDKIKTIDNTLKFLGQNFSILSIKYNDISMDFNVPDLIKKTEILTVKELKIEHFVENTQELENLETTTKIIVSALENNRIHNDNLIMSHKLSYLFKNFLPDKVVDDLLSRKSQKSLMTGEKREVAVIFSHIKNFNNIEESLSADGVVNFLNNHFSGLSTKIKENGGEINKFIGDAVFAMVGAPLSFNNNEERAINAAIDMTNFIIQREEDYKIGIGIHIGKAIIGNIGSEDNFDYTAIGDTINLAARLESLCKYYDVNILVSNTIHAACIKQDSPVTFRKVDTVMVQGKDEPTTIYSVEDLSSYPIGFINTYNKGLKMFKLGNWNFATNYFLECKQQLPNDRIINIYLERCNNFLKIAPENWLGAITLDFK